MKPSDVLLVSGVVGAAASLLFLARRAAAASAGPATESASNGRPAQAALPPIAALALAGVAGAASVDVDAETRALGRIVASEDARGTPAERVAVAWVARNRARKRGESIEKMVCVPHCGPQSEKGGRLRPFSSARAARGIDLALAAGVLAAPEAEDPTGGATSCIVPALQDQLVDEKHPGYTRTYAQVRERWIKGGLRPLGRVGKWELWR